MATLTPDDSNQFGTGTQPRAKHLLFFHTAVDGIPASEVRPSLRRCISFCLSEAKAFLP